MADLLTEDCCVWNGGAGAWAFEPLALSLASALGVEISPTPRRYNYLLHADNYEATASLDLFIPMTGIRIAADKRLQAQAFRQCGIPTPATFLCDSFEDALKLIREHEGQEWCLKYPIGCGANGHRFLRPSDVEPPRWPKPFVVQEFIRLEEPAVYRTYCVAGELFGWVVRRFPKGVRQSPWVAHARGARYLRLDRIPEPARNAARAALDCAGLTDSFGCVDLLQKPSGEWLVLEIGTDGLFNHVDRDLGDAELQSEIQRRIARAFWQKARLTGG